MRTLPRGPAAGAKYTKMQASDRDLQAVDGGPDETTSGRPSAASSTVRQGQLTDIAGDLMASTNLVPVAVAETVLPQLSEAALDHA